MSIDMHTAVVGDIEIAYRETNASAPGPAWVFVHGLGEDSRSWIHQQSALTGIHTFAVDARGHGGTTLGGADGTLDQLATDLIGFLDQVAGPSVCVGFSMGGAICLAAAAASSAVRHVVCVCSSSTVGASAAHRFETRAAGIDASGREFAQEALRKNLETSVLAAPQDMDAQVAMRLDAIGDGLGYANGARAMASMRHLPLVERLGTVACPVDVFVGELDESCPWRAGERIANSVQHGSCHWLPGVGHFVNIEQPSVLTNALVNLRS